MLIDEIKNSKRGMYNAYQPWVESAVRVVFLTTNGSESDMVKRTCEITGVSSTTVVTWSRGYYKRDIVSGKVVRTNPWLTVLPLQQTFKRKISIPECPMECMVLMAKMLWVAHERGKQ